MRQFCHEVNREELRSELANTRILDETTKLGHQAAELSTARTSATSHCRSELEVEGVF